MYKLILLFLVSIYEAALHSAPANIAKRFVPAAQTAATTGNVALYHNPAGLAFMGGAESGLSYLYEWSELGNRHHGGVNLAINFLRLFSIAGAVNTQAAFVEKAKNNLGTDLIGIFGAGIKLTQYSAFGVSFLKSHNFLTQKSTPVLITFGMQLRPWSFLSMGAHYEEVDGAYFAAPNITAGLSVRPYKEFLTLGIDSRFVARGREWQNGFATHPVFSIATSYQGYGIALGAEIPGIKTGWNKPIFSATLDFNLAHLGVSFTGLVNSHENNFAVGGHVRTSTEEWSSIGRPHGLWVQLSIDHDGTIEKRPGTLAERLFAAPQDPLSVLALLKRIESDRSISGVVLKFNGFNFGDARTQEWRDTILSLRAAKKEVIIYLDSPSERDYYIASAANKIQMNRYATLSLRHFQATLIYFADLLNNIGVKADAVAAGSYKTAPRQWTNSRPGKQEIEVANNILTSFYETLIDDVAKARNIDRVVLQELFDRGEITSQEAKNAGLIDDIINPDGMNQEEASPTTPKTFYANYDQRQFKQERWHAPRKIVVLPINHAIVDGRALPGLFSFLSPVTGAKDVIDEIEDTSADPTVVGMIIRIDSPGGDAGAGHRINQALVQAQKQKPIVTSMSDVAASAGFMIAAGTEHILAMPNTITGSIGVFSLMFSGEKLADKIGIFSKELSVIKNPGPTILRRISESERKEAQRITDWYYENFIQTVSTGLKLEKDEVRKHADGHVWLGKEAIEKKLIHELGGFAKAVESIRMLAGVADDEEVNIEIRTPGQRQQFSMTTSLLSLFKNHSADIDIKRLSKIADPYVRLLKAYELNGIPQARLPFDIEWRRSNH